MRRIKRALHMASASVVAFSSLLSLAIVPMASAASYTCTWTGAANDDKFSTAGNWSGCNSAAPQTGDTDAFIFDNTSLSAYDSVNNDVTGLTATSFTFTGSSTYTFTINGNAMTLAGNVTSTATNGAILNTPLTLTSSPTVNVGAGYFYLGGVISGTGNITKTGTGGLGLDGANTFTGSVTASAGSLLQDDNASFGITANNVTVNDGADLTVGCGVTDLPNSVTLTGNSSNPGGQYPSPKLLISTVCAGGGAPDEMYGAYVGTDEITLTGNITLGSDVVFGSNAKTTTLTGALSGSNKFTLPSTWGGALVIASNSNTSGMANGTYKPDVVTQTLSDDQSAHSVEIESNAVITIDGKRGDTDIRSGGVLKGTGTVGQLIVNAGATVAPGHSPGCMNVTGGLVETGTYQAELGGADACTGYDQLKVTGTVDLTGGTLDVVRYNDFKDFTAGQTFTIIDNDDTDAVTGTFTGLAEGATIQLDDGTVLGISYVGGDGNDVVLTVKNVPTTPDTGFAALTAHPLTTLAITLVAAGGIAGLAHKSRKLAARR